MKRKTWIIGIVLAVLVVAVVGLLIAGAVWLRYHGGPGSLPLWRWHMPRALPIVGGGGLLMLALWGLVIGGLVALFAGLAGPRRAPPGAEPSALDILKRRYAAGELDREQYERMREDLLK